MMQDLAVESILYKLVEAGTSMGLDDPHALGIKALQILAVLTVMLLAKKGWGGYRKNFKFSTDPLYWGSRDLAAKGGWGGIFLLPLAAMETVLLPLTATVGLFSRRSAKEKRELGQKQPRMIGVLKKQNRIVSDRVKSLELHAQDVTEAIEELHLNLKKLFTTVKTTKTKLAQLAEENSHLRHKVRATAEVCKDVLYPRDAEAKTTVKLRDDSKLRKEVYTPDWAKELKLDT